MNSNFYNKATVAEIIEEYCDTHQINEADFATIIDVHPTHLSRIKRGSMCSATILQKIAALGKRTVKDLILETPDEIKEALVISGSKTNLPVSV